MANYSGTGAPSNGSVYVCNLPHGTDETMLAEYFGTIGLIKVVNLTGYYLKFHIVLVLQAFCFVKLDKFKCSSFSSIFFLIHVPL